MTLIYLIDNLQNEKFMKYSKEAIDKLFNNE